MVNEITREGYELCFEDKETGADLSVFKNQYGMMLVSSRNGSDDVQPALNAADRAALRKWMDEMWPEENAQATAINDLVTALAEAEEAICSEWPEPCTNPDGCSRDLDCEMQWRWRGLIKKYKETESAPQA